MITNEQRLKLIELFADYQRAHIDAMQILTGKRDVNELDAVMTRQDDAVKAFTNYVKDEL